MRRRLPAAIVSPVQTVLRVSSFRHTGRTSFVFPVYKKEGQYGDLYLTYQVKLPTRLSDREKELFTELSKLKHGK